MLCLYRLTGPQAPQCHRVQSHDTTSPTFSPPLALLLLSQSAGFVLAAFAWHRLCAGGRAGIWLSWLQHHHLFLGEDARATVTPLCSAVIFTACGTDSGLVLPFLPFLNFYCGQNNATVRCSLRSILCLSVIIYILKNGFTWCSCCSHWFKQNFIQDKIKIQRIVMCSSTSCSL